MRRTVRTAILRFRDLQECNPAAIFLLPGPLEPDKHSTNPHPKLHPHAYATRPNFRATASEAPFAHEALYSGIRPDARTASAHAAATCGPSPRPRYSAAVSSPASAAVSERRAQKQTLTACPSSTTATTGDRPGISAAVHPEKWRASNRTSSTRTVASGSSTVSGKANAGPEYTSPPASALYRSACTGASRKSAIDGSSHARPTSSSAISCGTSARTAQAQLVQPRMSAKNGPGSGSGSLVPRIRPALSNRNSVRRCRSGVLTGQPERRHYRPPTSLPSQIDRAQQIPHLDRL